MVQLIPLNCMLLFHVQICTYLNLCNIVFMHVALFQSRHNKMGQSAGARTKDKQLFFFTFLEDSNEVVFNFYKGIPPSNWREDDMYYLEACPQVRTCLGLILCKLF